MCGTVYGDMHLKHLLGSIVRVGYCIPCLGFLSSATWHSLPKKHYNGLINRSINQSINWLRPSIFSLGWSRPERCDILRQNLILSSKLWTVAALWTRGRTAGVWIGVALPRICTFIFQNILLSKTKQRRHIIWTYTKTSKHLDQFIKNVASKLI